jgi:hypothetical protein
MIPLLPESSPQLLLLELLEEFRNLNKKNNSKRIMVGVVSRCHNTIGLLINAFLYSSFDFA